MKKRILGVLLTLTMVVGLVAGCGSKKEDNKKSSESTTETSSETSGAETTEKAGFSKIALLLPGVITDQGWNTNAYNGLMALQDMGYDCTYTESVETANIETTIRTYADQGYELLILHGSQFADAAIMVAPDYKDKYFFVVGNQPAGTECPENVGFIYNTGLYIAYMAGAVAALSSETGTIGYLGGIESDSQLVMKYAFIDGATHVNPDINVISVMAGTFDDSALGKEAALSMIEQGADVLIHTADTTGLGLIEAAKEHNVKIIGYGGDQHELAPDLVITSIVEDIPMIITSLPEKIENGTFSGLWVAGLDDHIKYLADYAEWVDSDVITKAQEIYDQVASGAIELKERYE